MTKYIRREDYEDFTIPNNEIYKIACCDCGLVHDFVFITQDGEDIEVAVRRNNRATGQRRRHLKKDEE